jgi:hypothetical protein
MLREERRRMEMSNASNGVINSVPRVAVNHQAGERDGSDERGGDGAMTADTCSRLSVENTNSPPRHIWPSKEEANRITQ